MKNSTEILGLYELQKFLDDFGEIPKKSVSKAAKQGIMIAYRAAERMAPIKTGKLRMGLNMIGEKTKIPGKKVYQLSFSKSMNEYFVKKHKATLNHSSIRKYSKKLKLKDKLKSLSVGSQVQSYYPASMEFGYISRSGKHIPGIRYLRRSIDDNEQQIQDEIIRVLNDEIDLLR